jgi:hypothetical protein
VSILLDHKADIKAQASNGNTSLYLALWNCSEDTVFLLLDREAGAHFSNSYDQNMLCWTLDRLSKLNAFVVVCCGADSTKVRINQSYVTQATVDACIAECNNIHAFLKRLHQQLMTTLCDRVEVDTRVGRGGSGIYHEPLERVMEYLGLSLSQDQAINPNLDATQHRQSNHEYKNDKSWVLGGGGKSKSRKRSRRNRRR